MKHPKVGEECFYAHLEYIHTKCIVKNVLNFDEKKRKQYEFYEVEFLNNKKQLIVLRAFPHELYDSEKDYKKEMYKKSIKMLTKKVKEYHKYKEQLDQLKKQLERLEK